jgi:hypothetical protein
MRILPLGELEIFDVKLSQDRTELRTQRLMNSIIVFLAGIRVTHDISKRDDGLTDTLARR